VLKPCLFTILNELFLFAGAAEVECSGEAVPHVRGWGSPGGVCTVPPLPSPQQELRQTQHHHSHAALQQADAPTAGGDIKLICLLQEGA
jgi:hypothetical protein